MHPATIEDIVALFREGREETRRRERFHARLRLLWSAVVGMLITLALNLPGGLIAPDGGMRVLLVAIGGWFFWRMLSDRDPWWGEFVLGAIPGVLLLASAPDSASRVVGACGMLCVLGAFLEHRDAHRAYRRHRERVAALMAVPLLYDDALKEDVQALLDEYHAHHPEVDLEARILGFLGNPLSVIATLRLAELIVCAFEELIGETASDASPRPGASPAAGKAAS